ncbi:MAG TPA: hydrolase 1, exosortase A system-associated [Burkholderiales bacterium]|nr:hydrolase 1, exosortase A system-associated [Burkholderiales bacterium]
MMIRERALVFDCDGDELVGILAVPHAQARFAVVIVVGGPQYRVGGHRQFVRLARHMASCGFAVLRFDHRGMGDSSGSPRGFEHISRDIEAGIDAVTAACPQVRRVVLLGLCDGASAALMYAPQDKRVAGIVMLNPWILSSESFARSQIKHHYLRRLLQRAFWAKLVRGEVDFVDALRVLARAGRRPVSNAAAEGNYQDSMAAALTAFRGDVLLILSGQDPTARSFMDYCTSNVRWRGLVDRSNIESRTLPQADHTFSTSELRAELERITVEWLSRTCVSHPAAAITGSISDI